MSALTADRNTTTLGSAYNLNSFPVAASTIIYKGSMVALNSSGYAVPASGAANLVSAGIATAHVDNSTGSAGALSVQTMCIAGKFANDGSITIANVGKNAYFVDDQTIGASTSAGLSVAGPIYLVESSSVAAVRLGIL
jgi:hypothetical protein